MKKLPEYTSDDNMFFYMNALVDLVNSQQEAIERLEKTSHEVKGMGEALVNHYNDPSAHKQELEAPVDDCDTESTDWPTVDVQNILYKHFYVDEKSHQKVMMADYEIRTLLEKYEAVYEKPEMVSKVWTADFIEKYRPALESLAKADDTHRTVTLRIPKDMTIGRLLYKLLSKKLHGNMWDWLEGVSDTDLQKALDEVEYE